MQDETSIDPGLDDFLCFAVYSAGHAFNRIYKPLLDELGLTYPQYLTLVALWSKDNQTVGSLSEALFLESNTLTPMLKRLEALGHIVRTRDPLDERQVRVTLSDQGRALQQRACLIPHSVLEASGMSVSEMTSLQQQISKLRDRLRSIPGPS